MNGVEGHGQTAGRDGWILYEGDEPVGAGPSMHAAIGDARRRTGWPENSRQRLRPATAEEVRAATGRLGPGGLTAAESAWCAGTMNSVPAYRRPVDYAGKVLAVAERLGGRREGLMVRCDDGSELELLPLQEHLGGGELIRLPPREEDEAQGRSRGEVPGRR